MSDQDPTPSPTKQPHRWQKGMPSPNPKGRPRSGLAFAERVRERIDPDMIIDLAVRVAEDETLSAKARLEALWPLIDRGFIKPPTTIAAQVHTTSSPTRDWSAVPLETCEALLDQLDGALARSRVTDPKVLDGEAVVSPALVAHVPTGK